MEIRRLLSKKVMLAGILIYLFQAIAFIVLQLNNGGFQEMQNQNIQYNQLVESLRNSSVEESLIQAQGLLEENRNDTTICLVNKLIYLAGFKEDIQAIFDNAEKMQEFSIFQNQNSFSYVNMIKTAKDFEKMRDVSLTLDKDRATEHLLTYSYLTFFVFAFMIYVLYEVLRERDNGMWEATHVMKNGRYQLAADRGAGLTAITIIFYLCCFLTDLVLACSLYGIDHFSGLIQTIEAYAKYPIPISKGFYLCLFVGKNSLALAAMILLAYLLFTVLRNRNLAIVLLLAGLFAEGQLIRSIPVYSNLRILRYVNLLQIFDVAALDREYQNLNFFGTAISTTLVLFLIEVLLIFGCFCLVIIVYGRQYPGKSTWFEDCLRPVQRMVQKVLERIPFVLKEAYKILISKRGVFFIFFGVVICMWISEKTEVNFPDLQKDMDEAYLIYGGNDWSVFNSYVEDLEYQREYSLARAEELQEQMRAGILGAEKLSEISMLQSRAASILIYLREYSAKQEQRALQEQRGIYIYAMSNRGYNEILGPNSRLREIMIGVLVIALCVIIAAQVYGVEKQAHTNPLLKSTARGIVWVWKKKLLCIWGIVGILLCIFLGGNLIHLLQNYHTPYLQAPIQSLTFYAEETAHISILQMMIINGAFKIAFAVCAVAVTLFISSHKRVINQMYVPSVIIVLSVFYVIGLAINAAWFFLTAEAALVLLTILGIAGAYRNWCLKF